MGRPSAVSGRAGRSDGQQRRSVTRGDRHSDTSKTVDGHAVAPHRLAGRERSNWPQGACQHDIAGLEGGPFRRENMVEP